MGETAKKNVKYGVNLDVATAEIMLASCAELSIEVKKGQEQDAGVLAGLLVAHYRKSVNKEELFECEECGGVFPDMKRCPYCGDSDDEEEDVKDKGKKEAKKNDKPAAETSQDKPADAKPAEPKGKGKGGKVAKIENPAKDKKPGSEIVPAADAALTGLSVKDLDDATKEVLRLKVASGVSMHELGSKLQEIHEKQLWKLRTDDKGKPTYRSFDAYCSAEIKMSHTACYGLINVAQHYTPEKMQQIGTSKLVLILKAPEEDREELERQAASGQSKSQIQKRVAALRAQKGVPTPKAPKVARGGSPLAASAASKGRKSEHITIVSVLGKKTVQAYCKPAKKGDALEAVVVPKHVKDWLERQQPFAGDNLGNGVREVFVLAVDAKDRLQVRIDRKRVDE